MFYPETAVPPTKLQTEELLFVPLTPAHVHLDYNALMVSKEMLRRWGGHGWPSDDFTIEANRQDLEWHDQEHRENIAYTYTILTPDESECLGCVYIKPLRDIQEDAPDFHAIIRYWVIEPRLIDGLEKQVLTTLIHWFNSDAWQFKRMLLHTRQADVRQLALFREAGLSESDTIELSDRGGLFVFFDLLQE